MNKKNYSPHHIANFFLNEKKVTNYVLNKLIYFSYGFYLATTNEKLFPEKIQAWKYGPVVSQIYEQFVRFGNKVITEKATWHSRSMDKITYPEIDRNDAETMNVLKSVKDVYGSLSEDMWEEMTHHEGSPWEIVYREGERDILINDSDTKRYFASRLPFRELKPEIASVLDEGDDHFSRPYDNAKDFMESLDKPFAKKHV